jgi:hypothetical protein
MIEGFASIQLATSMLLLRRGLARQRDGEAFPLLGRSMLFRLSSSRQAVCEVPSFQPAPTSQGVIMDSLDWELTQLCRKMDTNQRKESSKLVLRTKPVFKFILTEVTVWSFCAFSAGAFP